VTAPTNFTVTGAVGQYSRTGEYPGTANVTLQVDGGAAVGATSIPLRGGIAGRRLYAGELLWIVSTGLTITGTVHTFDGTGRVTVPIGTTLGSAFADGETVDWRIASTPAGIDLGPFRPVSFPSEPAAGADVMRLLSGNVQSVSHFVPVTGTVQVNAAAGVSIRSSNDVTYLSSTYWPTLTIRNVGAGTAIATGTSPAAAANSTAHYTLSASASLSASATIAARVTTGTSGGSAGVQWQGVRWLSLWLGTGPAMGIQNGSGTNTLWHRAQDVLASFAAGTRYTVRGVDLTRLQTENGALALGQSVRLRSELLGVDVTVKIVKLDYDFAATESLNLELGAITPRLTGVTVSL